MNNENKPPMPPRWDRDDPSHIPHFPDWPNVPYADWPRTRFHRWNDSEPANVQPWWQDCCEPYENPCVCVTSADVDLWNSYSGLSGLTALNPNDISAALSAYDDLSARLDQMSGYEDLEYGYALMSANSGIWNSAGYVPNIYENLSALASGKLDASAVHVWTDSEKIAYDTGAYGNYSGTLVGIGTYERPLRASMYLMSAVASVDIATSGYKVKLANLVHYDEIKKDIDALNKKVTAISGDVSENRRLLEWILDHMNNVPEDLMKIARS